MKKIIFISLLSFCAFVVFAQLKVTPDGKVGIGIGNQTPISKLAVGALGDLDGIYFFQGEKRAVWIHGLGNMPYSGWRWGCGLYVDQVVSSVHGDFAIAGQAYKTSYTNTGKAIGVLGTAENAKDGCNFGVVGILFSNHEGTGIYGSDYDENRNINTISVDGKYAGYFEGNVKVTGTVNGTVIAPSDLRFKQNVIDLGSGDRGDREVLNAVTSLNPISYNFKQVYRDLPPSDTIQEPQGMFDEKSQVFNKKHYGLIAQDLQNIYPDLVYENDNGYLSINYTELIPLLIQSIKELKEEVDQLSAALVGVRSTTANGIIAESARAVLYQNAPNPFTERTEIKFDLPENAKNAFIYIFNMQGALVKQIAISSTQRSILINGSELTAGMYLYSLLVDGKEVDTKKMILTK